MGQQGRLDLQALQDRLDLLAQLDLLRRPVVLRLQRLLRLLKAMFGSTLTMGHCMFITTMVILFNGYKFAGSICMSL